MTESAFLQLLRLIVLALAFSSVSVSADERQDARESLALQIINNPASQLDQAALQLALAETIARPLFLRLRGDAGWGPEDPQWKALFLQFLGEFIALSQQLSSETNDRLQRALANQMTERELREVLQFQRDPSMTDALKVLKDLGMDVGSTYRMVGIISTPGLYSQAEKEALKAKMSALKDREAELLAIKPRLDALMSRMGGPAFQKYRQAMAATLSESLNQLQTDEIQMNRLRSFISVWKGRVSQ